VHFGFNTAAHKKFHQIYMFSLSRVGLREQCRFRATDMCNSAAFSVETAFDRRKWHKRLDLGAVDAFYGPEFGAFCQNTCKAGLVFALRHQASGPPTTNGIQARR
jgi:hypothetical protein